MARVFSWLAAWLGTFRSLKAVGQKALENSMKADIAVASAVMEAETYHQADQYCLELEANGQPALAAEIRRRLTAMGASPPVQVCGGQSEMPDRVPELPGPVPMQLPGPAPLALPAPQPQKRKPGRPRKNPLPQDDNQPTNLPDTPF